LRIAVLSAEAVPYSKTGGLGDVAGALPKALRAVGEDAFLITPCYWQTKGEYLQHVAIDDLWVDWRGTSVRAKAFYSEANGSPTFLIDYPPLFHRDSIYGFGINQTARRVARHCSFERLALRICGGRNRAFTLLGRLLGKHENGFFDSQYGVSRRF
jgi:glycogen synthase